MPESLRSESSGGEKKRHKRSALGHLYILLWKSLLLKRKHWLLTLVELILPIGLFSVVLFIRLLPNSIFVPGFHNETSEPSPEFERDHRRYMCWRYSEWDYSEDKCSSTGFHGVVRVFYGPSSSNFTEGVAKYVINELNMPDSVLHGVSSNDDIDLLVRKSYFESNSSWPGYFIGLFVNDVTELQDGKVPEHFDYDIRISGNYWNTEMLYPFFQVAGPGYGTSDYDDGFTLLQSLVDRYYISRLTGNDTFIQNYTMATQDYPYPPYYDDNGVSQIYGTLLPTFIVLSLVLLSPSLIKSVVHEKETGVRELVRLMGMNRWLVWFGWFLHSFLVLIVVVSVITIMLSVGLYSTVSYVPPILTYSDSFFVWIFLILYSISAITFCMAISTFFSRPTLAMTVGILVWLMSYYIPNSLMYYRYDKLGLSAKVLSCLLPNMAVTWAFRVIEMFEGRALGVHWGNLWTTGSPRDQLTPGLLTVMLVVDTCLYLIIIWYVDQVSPGTYGVPLPWYFPVQKTYWLGAERVDRSEEFGRQMNESRDDQQYFEEEPAGLKPGIVIKNLRKEFRTLGRPVKVAVEDVCLTCYEGQCTVLLGHNGAGKTTTMSVLTGVYAPTSGYAEVGGWNIATNLSDARAGLGLCPQHNMLFVDLTVLQHLLFFGMLKGMSLQAAKTEALTVLGRLDLLDKKSMFGNQLSGGMKRKLCLAISLVGDSKVVILDEPSSGLDPESRRWVWDVVQGERGRRTFLLTTHHMEEADVLGDRVAIMDSGRVVAAGSTLFLKNRFGDGYTLEMLVTEDSDVEAIKKAVQEHLPLAHFCAGQSGEIMFKLPPSTHQFAKLLDKLTSQKDHLGIKHVGLSLTTMERVFLRVNEVMEESRETPDRNGSTVRGSLVNGSVEIQLEETISDDSHDGINRASSHRDPLSDRNHLHSSNSDREKMEGTDLLLQRTKAFFVKRAIYSQRKWLLFITQGLLPILATVMCMLVDQAVILAGMEPPLRFSISLFPKTFSFVSYEEDFLGLAHEYESLFSDQHKISNTTNMTGSLLNAAAEDLFVYREEYITSADFSYSSDGQRMMKVLSQTVPYHTQPTGMNLIDNALVRFATDSHNYSISTTNRPLPPDDTWNFSVGMSVSSLVYANVMPMALAFLSASFLVYPLQERETRSKQIQVMTGASAWLLWSVTLVWDLLAYLVTAFIIFIIFISVNPNDYFLAGGAGGALFLLLMLYGWGGIPMAYVFSFLFQSAASGFAVLALVNIVTGQMLSTVVWALEISQDPIAGNVSIALNWISSLVPSYPVARGFMHLVDTSVYNVKCDKFNATITNELCATLAAVRPYNDFVQCCPTFCALVGNKVCFKKRSYFRFDHPGMSPELLTLFVNGLIFLGIIAIIEGSAGQYILNLWRKITCKGKLTKAAVALGSSRVYDEDVDAEARLVGRLLTQGGSQNLDDSTAGTPTGHDSALFVVGLAKHYFGSLIRAVDGITFRVGRGECLGLLGVNGAGKTTTFKMLTGDEYATEGDAFMNGVSLKRQRNKFVKQIGYCPQFDAFMGEFTGVELLTLLGRLRGMRDVPLKQEVCDLVSLVDLTECAQRPSSTYSGGNRRKLSTAMALVGSPPVVFLDEPTSGVDPSSRRKVWTAVSQAISNGQSVVLTSHSMEECEALCSRIIIMSRGALRCVGSTGHLKAKFGQGYSLQVKLKTHGLDSENRQENDRLYEHYVSQLKIAIPRDLPGAALTDQHKGMLAYRIPKDTSWGRLFSVMEALKESRIPEGNNAEAEHPQGRPTSREISLIEDYAASDTSLEQVFLAFAREAAAMLDAGPLAYPITAPSPVAAGYAGNAPADYPVNPSHLGPGIHRGPSVQYPNERLSSSNAYGTTNIARTMETPGAIANPTKRDISGQVNLSFNSTEM